MYQPYKQRTEDLSRGYAPVIERVKSSVQNFFAPSPDGVRIRDVVREAVPQVAETAAQIVKAPVSVAMAPADLISTAATGKPLPALDIPGLGETKSYSRRALDYQKEPGYTPVTAGVRAASEGILDVAALGSIFKSAGVGSTNIRELMKPKPAQGTVEQIIETQGGWKPGMKQQFDTALARKDAATIQKLLPDTPKEYQTRFAKEISDAQLQGLQKAPDTITLYRGENPSNVGGAHFTTDPTWAKNFGDKTLTGALPKDSKVVVVSKDLVDDALATGAKSENDVYQHAFKKGADAVIGTDPMNPSKIDVIVKPELISKFKTPSSAGPKTIVLDGVKYESYPTGQVISPADRSKMIKMREAGNTFEEIGKEFGVTRQRIEQFLKNASVVKGAKVPPLKPFYKEVGGVTSSGVPKSEYEAVRRFYDSGKYSLQKIGERYGVSKERIRQILEVVK